MKAKKITKAYTLTPVHIATIKATAKDNGDSSDSAALRHILDNAYYADQVTAPEAVTAMGVLLLGRLGQQPAPAPGGNGGEEEAHG
jgi:hypothetical protein